MLRLTGKGKPSRSPRKSNPTEQPKRTRSFFHNLSPLKSPFAADVTGNAATIAAARVGDAEPNTNDSDQGSDEHSALSLASALSNMSIPRRTPECDRKMPARRLHLADENESDEDDSDYDSHDCEEDEIQSEEELLVDEEAFVDDMFYGQRFMDGPEPPAPPPAARNRIPDTALWKMPYHKEDVPKHALPKFWVDFGREQFGGGGYLHWNHRDGKAGHENLDGTRVRKFRCTFHEESDCPFVAREIYDPTTETAKIQVGTLDHNDHSIIMPRRQGGNRSGVPKYVVSKIFCTPCKVDLSVTELCDEGRERHNLAINQDMKGKLKNALATFRKKRNGETGRGNTWGDLRSTFRRYFRENIRGFTENTAYCFGLRADSATGSLAAVISTEDLVLNLHRVQHWLGVVFICIDGSFRLTTEGFGVLPTTTVNLKQQSKIIAYGIILTENAGDIEYIVKQTMDECVRIVRARMASNTPILN